MHKGCLVVRSMESVDTKQGIFPNNRKVEELRDLFCNIAKINVRNHPKASYGHRPLWSGWTAEAYLSLTGFEDSWGSHRTEEASYLLVVENRKKNNNFAKQWLQHCESIFLQPGLCVLKHRNKKSVSLATSELLFGFKYTHSTFLDGPALIIHVTWVFDCILSGNTVTFCKVNELTASFILV